MARIERKHQVLTQPLDQELLRAKASEGWRPVGVVWERTVEGDDHLEPSLQPVPYGLRIGDDCQSLAPAADEIRAMIRMLKGIVDERPFSEIAADLNATGFHTRTGAEWNQSSVFHMLPRLIEVAPSIYSSEEWAVLRPRLQDVS